MLGVPAVQVVASPTEKLGGRVSFLSVISERLTELGIL